MARTSPYKEPSLHGKIEKFDGEQFCRWQKKMRFLLTTLKVGYVISTPCPEGNLEEEGVDNEELKKRLRKMKKWENDNYLCVGHILNGLSNTLFDIYEMYANASEL
ncbi:unnamed protein product [Linum trigynum]|uniref:Uncharacterized protein n=1 Tax=Linum trigynum TaxID=586398 RepID=A0AAV2CGP9_9ROSI